MKSTYVLLAAMIVAPLPALAAGPAPFGSGGQHDQGRMGPPGRGPGPDGQMRSPERMFDRIDANHDGSISRAEFAAPHSRMMEHRRERRGERRPGGGFGGERRP